MLHRPIRILEALKGIIQAKHRFVKVNVIVETCYFMEGGDDDHGELFQGNKRHHRSIVDNFHCDTRRRTFIIVDPFLTQGISTF
jgi:hypothetical protein